MKTSTKMIWAFEVLLIVFLGIALWDGVITEWTFLAVALSIILAVWDNKRLKISKEGVEVEKDDKDEKNG
jgi:TRAP-type C4-dicarboxylate transport system permease large subunit